MITANHFLSLCRNALILLLALSYAGCNSRTPNSTLSNLPPGNTTGPNDPFNTNPQDFKGYEDIFNNTKSPEEPTTIDRPPVERTAREERCLTNDSSLIPDEGEDEYAMAPSTSSGECIAPRQIGQSKGAFNRDSFLQESLTSFTMMNSCFERVASRGPSDAATQGEVTEFFLIAKLALVRCYRQILRRSNQNIPWAPQQQQVAEGNDSNFLLMMSLMGNGE